MSAKAAQHVTRCPETYDGDHGTTDTQGRCLYCRRKIRSAAPKPQSGTPLRELDMDAAYRRTYDPDWGTGPADTDPCF